MKSELSPLYEPGISLEFRRAVQLQNYAVISAAIAGYELVAGRIPVPLEGLNVNGYVTEGPLLTVLFREVYQLLTYIETPGVQGALCRMDMRATQESMLDWAEDEIPYWQIETSIIETQRGYEGNGFAHALWDATETLIPSWLRYLTGPSRVLAYHRDGARGAEEAADERNGYRTGWTGNLLAARGYTNRRSELDYYLSEHRVNQAGDPDRQWIKILRY